MGKLCVSLIALLLGACGSTPPPATEEEKNAVLEAQYACLTNAAKELDDHKSDASTIAVAVAGKCVAEFDAAATLWGRTLPPMAAAELRRQAEDQAVVFATRIVLEERRGNSN
jgi:hypothetical protein